MVARPVQEVVDEVEQGCVRPLEVLEDEHGRVLLRKPFEEEAPGGEEILAVRGNLLVETKQLREPRFDPGALVSVEQMPLERLVQLPRRRFRLLLLRDPRPHSHHLRERPVRDALAIGEATAAVPVHVAGEAVDVLLELPREPRLADPGDPDDRDEAGLPLVARGVEEILDQAQLSVAADERGLEAGGTSLAPPRRDHPRRAPERHRLRLALQLVLARVLVGDRRLARTPRPLADENGSRRRFPLDPRGRVDEVAGDHSLALGPYRDGRLARDHADAHRQPGRSDLVHSWISDAAAKRQLAMAA